MPKFWALGPNRRKYKDDDWSISGFCTELSTVLVDITSGRGHSLDPLKIVGSIAVRLGSSQSANEAALVANW